MADEQKQEEKKQEEVKQEASKKPEEAKPAAAPAPAPEAPVEEAKPEEAKPAKAAPTGKFKDLIKDIESLSVADLAELVKTLEDRFGVSGAPVAVAAPAPAGTPAEGGTAVGGEAPKKASFTVHLTASGDQKIAVIKALREVRPDLGLKEAKDLVDGAPKDVAANVAAEAAEEAKKKLEAAGAKVELK